jgi:hypothetical protein
MGRPVTSFATSGRRALGFAPLALLTLLACDPGKVARNKECDAFSAWSNDFNTPIEGDMSDAEKEAANTNEKKAAMYRRFAVAARKRAQVASPFTDAYVKALGARWLDV